ncbi:DUF3891 family protein [Alkalihalobacillus sp. BA299]|uniref:DUF3891 family protein n=1 Tax=Alkalihalobacillus sp. BA299 TaxID=2815938 RepID=UPI001ADA70E6|nr:DUF3891 family protein [Alkalihalobacillus sp. BA299]
MIIRETNDAFIMIKQHDHAFISGEVAKHFKCDLLKAEHFFDDAIFAAYEHDRSWIGLDETPIWNDQANLPYSFSDFPLLPKIAFYTIGLDEIEKVSPYASLLCSLHYSSFFSHSNDEKGIQFLNAERKRQEKIKGNIPDLDHALLLEHYRLLQFCDDLSLYFCLNELGIKKEQEHPWFINGFSKTELFNDKIHPLFAEWLNPKEITIRTFPFSNEFKVTLKYKTVLKNAIEVMGIAKAYENSLLEEQQIFILK